MDENMIQYIYGNTNAKVSHNRIRWNITSSTEVPDENTPGKIGDVLIITNADVKKIKYVVTKDVSESNLQDNSINVYEDFTQNHILVNESNGFKMYIQGTQQNIMLDGNVMIANVFFYDGLTNSWKQFLSAYKDAVNLNSFTGQNLITILNEIWGGPEYTEALNEENMLPTIVNPQVTDTMVIADFSGSDLDVDTYWNGPSLTDEALINNLIPA